MSIRVAQRWRPPAKSQPTSCRQRSAGRPTNDGDFVTRIETRKEVWGARPLCSSYLDAGPAQAQFQIALDLLALRSGPALAGHSHTMTSTKSPHISARLALVLAAVLLVATGAGCRAAPSSAAAEEAENITDVSAFEEVPVKALGTGVRTVGMQVQSDEVRRHIDAALSQDSDFVLLRQYFLSQGYSYDPQTKNYISATSPSGEPLVGLSYRVASPDNTSTAILVSLYPVNVLSSPAPQAMYTYLIIFKWSLGHNDHLWAAGGRLLRYTSVVN